MLETENITKKFPGVTALDRVTMQLHPGKVNAILGENGAGKSTLMKILSGVYVADGGRLLLNGVEVLFSNPKEAQNLGISIIHQELNLVPYLTITENIFLGRELSNDFGFLDRKAMKAQTKRLLQKLKLNIHPDTLVCSLKVGQQQVVEIAKALLSDCSVLIMDEPTSAISESEVDVLFDIIRELKKENTIIVYISHKLDELFKIADYYTVLRDGRTIESGNIGEIDAETLIQKMVGRPLAISENQSSRIAGPPLLQVDGLKLKNPANPSKNLLKDVSFELHPGEILGIFGLMGAGRTELLETIFGLHPKLRSGNIHIKQQALILKSPADAMKAGIALVPEDRKKDGLMLDLDVKTNVSITMLNTLQKGGILNDRAEKLLVGNYISQLQIKTPSPNQLVGYLSGGNQQKIVLAKCLATAPKILMLDEPTRGIDIHAKNEIYKLIKDFAAKGMGIIVVSSELPEILGISDRILVMSEGQITANINIQDATEDSILTAAIHKNS